MGPGLFENELRFVYLLHAGTQLFHLIFTQPRAHVLEHPCIAWVLLSDVSSGPKLTPVDFVDLNSDVKLHLCRTKMNSMSSKNLTLPCGL